jgi:hypothetical protein
MRRSSLAVAIVSSIALVGAGNAAFATMALQKSAKEAGFPAANCQYCHVDKLPKKGASTNNERGLFLEEQKKKKAAKEVDVSWLKDYVEKK